MAERKIMANDSAARLVMTGVSKSFGATRALEKVSLTARAGEVLALVGENGAGKSTLMKILAGAIRPDAGEIHLDGQSFTPPNPLAARQAGVAMIYQELSLAPHLSVEENISLGVEPSRMGWIHRREVRRRADEAIRFFDHPEIQPNIPVNRLSVAAQQLVEIARALASKCKVLIFDEPTSSLTQRDAQRLFELIGTLKRQGLAIIYISHFIEEVQQIADRVTVLRDGQSVATHPIADLTAHQIVTLMVGRQLTELYPRSTRQPGEVILSTRSLAGPKKPTDVSVDLHRGEVLGIAGLVGAGRTELLRTLFGLDPIRQGDIRLGVYAGPASPLRRWQQGAGLLSEDRKNEGLALSLSIADNMTLSHLEGLGPMNLVLPSRQHAVARKWIDTLGIRCRDPHQPVGDLSGGNQQKVALARLLYHDVDVLLLDEPTRGIDVAAKATIYQIIDHLACGDPDMGRPPKAVLIVSSYLPELMGICDRIAVMCRGRLGPACPIGHVNEHELMVQATGQDPSALV